jgi:hypothetical protein
MSNLNKPDDLKFNADQLRGELDRGFAPLIAKIIKGDYPDIVLSPPLTSREEVTYTNSKELESELLAIINHVLNSNHIPGAGELVSLKDKYAAEDREIESAIG